MNILLVWLCACGDKTQDTAAPTTLTPPSDVDYDGFSESDGDCDDNDPTVHPDAEDVPNDGIDQDCSGGDAQAPELSISDSVLDLQGVSIGCEDSATVTIRNSGGEPMTITAMSLNPSNVAMQFQPQAGGTFGFPVVLMSEQMNVNVSYAPMIEENWSGALVIESDAYGTPVTEIPIVASGSGRLEEQNLVQLDPSNPKPVDIIFAVDVSNSMTPYNEWVSRTSTFFDTLNGSGLSYRVSAVMHDDGCVQGSHVFIDNTYTSDQAQDVFSMMLEDPNLFNITHAEHGFTLLENALNQTDSGECNEGLIRPEAQLILIGVSDEPEQSVQSYSDFLTTFRTLKSDPNDVIVHGIGRDANNACTNAELYTGFIEAAAETGGIILPICTGSWNSTFNTLGQQIMQDALINYQTIVLNPPAVPETIQVSLNEQVMERGWTYQATDNRLEFDSATTLEQGDLIDVTYYPSVECP